MDVNMNVNAYKGVETYRQTQVVSASQEEKANVSEAVSQTRNTHDTMEISSEARTYMSQQLEKDVVDEIGAVIEETEEKPEITNFTTFSEEFSKTAEVYVGKARDYYSAAHQENLTFENPAKHIWDKYKNTESEYFRNDLSELERAWSYDQELDMLNGGKKLQMNNPFVFSEDIPQLSQVAIQANRACRSQIETAINDLLSENDITLPAGVSMRLTVSAGDYKISVSGIEDEELAESIEQILASGSNGKNLYEHIRLCNPAQFGFEEPARYLGLDLSIDYSNGHLSDIDTEYGYGTGQTEWAASVQDENCNLTDITDAADVSWTRFSGTYNPQLESMNKKMLSLHPETDQPQESFDRLNAKVRLGLPELREQVKKNIQNNLYMDPFHEIDPDGSIYNKAYWAAYADRLTTAVKHIEDYYSDRMKEFSGMTVQEGMMHLRNKYIDSNSSIFCSGILAAERSMSYRQELTLFLGGNIILGDPYALKAHGGLLNVSEMDAYAKKAAEEYLTSLLNDRD